MNNLNETLSKEKDQKSNWINKVVDELIDYELNSNRKKWIEKISNTINFKYNLFNIYLDKQKTGNTTSILKEMIKLSTIHNVYHLMN